MQHNHISAEPGKLERQLDRLALLGADYVDQTEFIKSTAPKCLELGELLMGSDFSLFQALAAIEIMDPKMDSGMNYSHDTTPPYAKYSQDSVFAFEPVGYQQPAAIAKRFLQCLATWLTGKTLAQTVFTGYLAHDYQRIGDPVLRCVTRTVLTFVGIVNDLCTQANVMFEEDLIRDAHGIPLPKSGQSVVENVLFPEIDILLDKKLNGSTSPLDSDQLFLRHFLLFFRHLMTLLLWIDNIEFDKKQFAKLSPLISESMKVISEAMKNDVDDECEVYGFEDLATKLVSTSAPLSPVKILSPNDACSLFVGVVDTWNMLIRDADKITQNRNFTSVDSLFDLLISISSRRPNILTRSMIKVYSTTNLRILGDLMPNTLIEESLRKCNGFELPSLNKNKECADIWKHLQHYTHEILRESIHVFCLNTGRLQRKLMKLLPTWDSLQSEAESFDQSLQQLNLKSFNQESFYVANWMFGLKLRLMEHVLWLGFDLDLYLECDLMSVYGYLDFIHTNMLMNKTRCKDLKNTSNGSHDFIEAHLMAKQEVCRGLFRMLVALQQDGILRVSESESKWAPLKYAHRFKYLLVLGSPQRLDYEAFKRNSDATDFEPSVLYENAKKSFESGKIIVEQLRRQLDRYEVSGIADIKNELGILAKCLLANLIAVKVMIAKREEYLSAGSETLMPKFDYSHSARIPVITVVTNEKK